MEEEEAKERGRLARRLYTQSTICFASFCFVLVLICPSFNPLHHLPPPPASLPHLPALNTPQARRAHPTRS